MKKQYLTFSMDNQVFGIPIERVREINRMTDITSVPNKAKYFIGVMNLRGSILPVISLRIKLGIEPIAYSKDTCLIVVENSEYKAATIVDAVRSVIDVEEDSIESIIEGYNMESFIKGFTRNENDIVILLDPDKTIFSEIVRSEYRPVKAA